MFLNAFLPKVDPQKEGKDKKRKLKNSDYIKHYQQLSIRYNDVEIFFSYTIHKKGDEYQALVDRRRKQIDIIDGIMTGIENDKGLNDDELKKLRDAWKRRINIDKEIRAHFKDINSDTYDTLESIYSKRRKMNEEYEKYIHIKTISTGMIDKLNQSFVKLYNMNPTTDTSDIEKEFKDIQRNLVRLHILFDLNKRYEEIFIYISEYKDDSTVLYLKRSINKLIIATDNGNKFNTDLLEKSIKDIYQKLTKQQTGEQKLFYSNNRFYTKENEGRIEAIISSDYDFNNENKILVHDNRYISTGLLDEDQIILFGGNLLKTIKESIDRDISHKNINAVIKRNIDENIYFLYATKTILASDVLFIEIRGEEEEEERLSIDINNNEKLIEEVVPIIIEDSRNDKILSVIANLENQLTDLARLSLEENDLKKRTIDLELRIELLKTLIF